MYMCVNNSTIIIIQTKDKENISISN